MEIIQASYLISSPSVDKCPAPDRPEYAFIGRSNVGKSSLINMLCQKKEVAKVSASPGKTQMINHFSVTGSDRYDWYLVDLPGYGFAKVAQSQRKSWQKMIKDYIQKRENLVNLFILVDSRVEPQKLDLDFINQLGEWQIPFAIAFTKADKSTQKETARNVQKFLEALKENWEEAPPHFVTSAVKHLGAKQILRFIAEQNKVFEQHKKGRT
ncbi:ribosome biogenesis GTP-binding protein YihA/YsxC [Flavisolibacter ginsenosidimutans]|uniref:Probable GTP-binding protein EngB n=1 Tax=Flavisolibacter ginsenosidimutans TaxID=661481 RepID=A0A5B8UIJ8_9BACT|nr:ribosome biogenesis GTP-binding protein YihA/YsxC [Flavisolibacter ginsenosidimutans]QEC56388.1 YihA family ribosome biogenesis GTP-binding protein [Flavisolibacter ginsenosidimutans]